MAIEAGVTVLTVRPDAACGPSRLLGWAEARGVRLDVRDPSVPGTLPTSFDGFDALIVLGGDMGVAETERHPWLRTIMHLLAEATDRALPTFGICLGAQLVALALGGAVERGAAGLETGVVGIHRLPSAADDPLLRGLPETFYSGAMHQDAVTRLPAGAELLAVGDRYPNQVFRYGNSWGVQFHPEIGPANYLAWGPAICGPRPGFRPEYERTAAEFARFDEQVEPACERLVDNFFDFVLASAARDMTGVRS